MGGRLELSFASRAPVGVTDLIENDPWVALTDEPGEYRLRVSARSRLVEVDPEDDLDVDNPESAAPAEFYLLDVWPAPLAEPVVRRLTGAFARHQLEDPPPPLPETDEGLAAADRIGRDLDQAPGSQQLSGAAESIEVVRTVPGTRRRLFVTCAHLTSFSTMVREGRGWIQAHGLTDRAVLTPFQIALDAGEERCHQPRSCGTGSTASPS